MTEPAARTTPRLTGLDLARFAAFFGMVVVNFSIAMGVSAPAGVAGWIEHAFEGRAAATFVVLAGVGLGLAAQRTPQAELRKVTLRRALFLFGLGLLNMQIFEADILHFYAVYFVIGLAALGLGTRQLAMAIGAVIVGFVLWVFTFDYAQSWNWETLAYADLWTLTGFARNTFFNGFHPVFPWVAFFLFGIVLSRANLAQGKTQIKLVVFGALALLGAEALSSGLISQVADPDLADVFGTAPLPPMPLYMLAGSGAAVLAIGACQWLMSRRRIAAVLTPLTIAGRHALTLYVGHIVVGMGILEALGLLGGATSQTALAASVIFTLFAIGLSLLWSRFFKRGPLEAVMRSLAG